MVGTRGQKQVALIAVSVAVVFVGSWMARGAGAGSAAPPQDVILTVPLSHADAHPPLTDAPSISAEQAQAAQAAMASNGPVGIALERLKAQLLPQVADRIATQGFRPYVDSLNETAGGVVIHSYLFRGCQLRIVVNPEVWNAMSASDQQSWEGQIG